MATDNMYRKFGENWTRFLRHARGQTDRQTGRHTHIYTLIAIFGSGGRRSNNLGECNWLQFKLTADDDAAGLYDRVWSRHLTWVLSVVPLPYVTHQQIVSVAMTLNRNSLPVDVDTPVGWYDSWSVHPEHDLTAHCHTHAINVTYQRQPVTPFTLPIRSHPIPKLLSPTRIHQLPLPICTPYPSRHFPPPASLSNEFSVDIRAHGSRYGDLRGVFQSFTLGNPYIIMRCWCAKSDLTICCKIRLSNTVNDIKCVVTVSSKYCCDHRLSFQFQAAIIIDCDFLHVYLLANNDTNGSFVTQIRQTKLLTNVLNDTSNLDCFSLQRDNLLTGRRERRRHCYIHTTRTVSKF